MDHNPSPQLPMMKSAALPWKKAIFCLLAVLGITLVSTNLLDYAVVWTAFFIDRSTLAKYAQQRWYRSYVEWKWLRAPFVPAQPAPELSMAEYSKDKLMRMTNGLSAPLIIRGALRDSVAVRTWSPAFLAAACPEDQLIVREMHSNSFEDLVYDLHSVAGFVEMTRSGRNVSVIGSSSLLANHPALHKQMRSAVDDDLQLNTSASATHLFMTQQQTPFHADGGINVVKQVHGSKQWGFIKQEQNIFLCPYQTVQAVAFKLCINQLYGFEESINAFGQGAQQEISQDPAEHYSNDLSNMSVEKWLSKVPRFAADVHPGDVVVTGPWVHHCVKQLPSGFAGQRPQEGNIGISYRIKDTALAFRHATLFTSMACKLSLCFLCFLTAFSVELRRRLPHQEGPAAVSGEEHGQ